MATYIMFTRLTPDTFQEPKEFKQVARKVSAKLRSDCPGVTWKESYTMLGRFDIVDIIECDDPRQVERAAMIIRAYGHAFTETMPATPWDTFLANL